MANWINTVLRVGSHFVQAEVEHFSYQDKDVALNWLISWVLDS